MSTVYIIVDNEVAILKEVGNGLLKPLSSPINIAEIEKIVNNKGYALL